LIIFSLDFIIFNEFQSMLDYVKVYVISCHMN